MLSPEQLNDLETKYTTTIHIKGKSGKWEVVLRKPKRIEWKRVRSMMHNPQMVADAGETMLRICCVHPAGDALDALLEEYPAIPEAVMSHALVQDAMGLTAEQEEK